MKALILSLLLGQPAEEFPVCTPLSQYHEGMQLVQLNVDPSDLQAQAFYHRKLKGGDILILRMTRAGCKEEWKPAEAKLFRPKKVCAEGSQCL